MFCVSISQILCQLVGVSWKNAQVHRLVDKLISKSDVSSCDYPFGELAATDKCNTPCITWHSNKAVVSMGVGEL